MQEAVKVEAEFERARQFQSLSMDDAMALARKRWTQILQEDAEERTISPEYHTHPHGTDELVPQRDEFEHPSIDQQRFAVDKVLYLLYLDRP